MNEIKHLLIGTWMPVFVFFGDVFEWSNRLQKALPKRLRDDGIRLVDAIKGFHEMTVTEQLGLVSKFCDALRYVSPNNSPIIRCSHATKIEEYQFLVELNKEHGDMAN